MFLIFYYPPNVYATESVWMMLLDMHGRDACLVQYVVGDLISPVYPKDYVKTSNVELCNLISCVEYFTID